MASKALFKAVMARWIPRLRSGAALRMFLPMQSSKMAFVVLAGLAALGLVASAHAQEPVQASLATGFHSIREDILRADLTFVAWEGVQGRRAWEAGDEVAIQWIASEFAKAGLQPAANGSFLQPVELIEYRGDREHSYVALKRGGSEKQWKFPEALGSYRDDVDVTANVVFAGFGITAPELHHDDYQGIDARGKIVLIFDHEPQETDPASIFNGTGNTRYATGRVKILNAQEHGAVGVLIVAEPNRKHPSNQERVARIGGSETRTMPIPLQALADDALHTPAATISDAVAKEIFATSGAAPSELQAAIDRDLKPQSRALPDAQVTLHYRNVSVSSGKTYNVVGLLEGSDPQLKAETILFSGHHDHNGVSGMEIWHGADDNGSGTVGVVALAHAYAANAGHGEQPKRSILFIVYAADERGLLGSFYMAAHPLRPLDTPRALLNFPLLSPTAT